MLSKLIFIEGLPGSGKTTLTKKILVGLKQKNPEAKAFLESELPNPINFAGHAYLTLHEFNHLKKQYPDCKFVHSVFSDDYVLVPYPFSAIQYKETKEYPEDLVVFLRSREFSCRPQNKVGFSVYSKTMLDRWEAFSKGLTGKEEFVFDGDILQHPLDDILHNYDISQSQIERHILKTADTISNSDAKLFYISQNNIEESLSRIAVERKRSIFVDPIWLKHWHKRKKIELSIIKKLPIKAEIIDNSNYDWANVYNTIARGIEK